MTDLQNPFIADKPDSRKTGGRQELILEGRLCYVKEPT